MSRTTSVAWGDFRLLWMAYGVSESGSAVAAGALPLIAVTELDAAAWQVTLMAVIGGVVAVVLALPLGPFVEFRAKRPLMIATDIFRFAVLASVPLAAWTGHLTFPLLCVAEATLTAGAIGFSAASSSNLKNLLDDSRLLDANSRLETTYWVVAAAGPPCGGLLISWLGSTVTVALNAVSFLMSALGVSRLRTAEPRAAARPMQPNWSHELTRGWREIRQNRTLSALFANAMLFGSGLLLISAIMPIFMLRDLSFEPWQYGLALGLPALGGVAGAALSARIARATSTRFVLLVFGTSRTLWAGLLCAAPPGGLGLAVIMTCDLLLMLSAGIFNPVFTTTRLRATPHRLVARVSATWSTGAKLAQTIGMLAGGLVASVASVRISLGVGACLMLLASFALPWRGRAAGDLDLSPQTVGSAEREGDI